VLAGEDLRPDYPLTEQARRGSKRRSSAGARRGAE
jgi:hypothetical protein